MFDLMSSIMILGFVIIWGVVKSRWPIQAPKMVFLYGMMQCMKTNFSARD
jgi:hypothetical protein